MNVRVTPGLGSIVLPGVTPPASGPTSYELLDQVPTPPITPATGPRPLTPAAGVTPSPKKGVSGWVFAAIAVGLAVLLFAEDRE